MNLNSVCSFSARFQKTLLDGSTVCGEACWEWRMRHFSSCSEPFQCHLLIGPILLEQLTSQKTPMEPMEAHGLHSRSDLTPEHPACFVINHFEIPTGLPMRPSNTLKCGSKFLCLSCFSLILFFCTPFLSSKVFAHVHTNEFYQDTLLAPSDCSLTSLYTVKQQIRHLPPCASQLFPFLFIPTEPS